MEKAKDEYDHIMMEEVKCVHLGLRNGTKRWLKLTVTLLSNSFRNFFKDHWPFVFSPLSQMRQVAEDGSPIRGRMLYDANAWSPSLKELYASKMNVSLLDWIKDRYAEADLFSDETLSLLP